MRQRWFGPTVGRTGVVAFTAQRLTKAVAVVGKKVSRPVDQLYRVQVGVFSFIENARQRLAEAQKAGFNDTFITQKLPLN